MFTELFQIYKQPFTLVRLGRNTDGGYVVPKELFVNDNLISCGISNEISFEEDYLKMNPDAKVFAYDGTINTFPSSNRMNFIWEKINIGATDTVSTISLNTIFEKYNLSRVCMKMDIEGAEYAAFSTLLDKNFLNIDCLVLEIHDVQPRANEVKQLIDAINKSMVLIHKHDNNKGSYFTAENKTFPNVYELTFINRRYFSALEPNNVSLPLPGLDFNNR